jgi:hypothetical protein
VPARSPRWPWVVGIATALILVAGTIVLVFALNADTRLRQAYDACSVHADGVQLGDDDHTLIVDGLLGDTTGTANLKDVGCINQQIEMPRAVAAQMVATRPIDGQQSATWDGFTMTWSYDADYGLTIILTEG